MSREVSFSSELAQFVPPLGCDNTSPGLHESIQRSTNCHVNELIYSARGLLQANWSQNDNHSNHQRETKVSLVIYYSFHLHDIFFPSDSD